MSKLEPLIIKVRNQALICHGEKIQVLFGQFPFKTTINQKTKVGLYWLYFLVSIACYYLKKIILAKYLKDKDSISATKTLLGMLHSPWEQI